MGQQIHWFPGHMKKALIEIEEKIKLVDAVIEILDARCPFSSINENLEKVISNKKKVVILNKIDLADSKKLQNNFEALKSKYDVVIKSNLKNDNIYEKLVQNLAILTKEKREKEIKKGFKPMPLRLMVIGIPNVGKSSLINRFLKKKIVGVANKPGFTRGEQWININNQFLLLDTPGVLPMNYDNKQKAINVALIGSIKEEIMPITDLVIYLVNFLKKNYPNSLYDRFGISTISDYETTMNDICKVRHLLDGNGGFSFEKAEKVLLKEFRDGKLGAFYLDE